MPFLKKNLFKTRLFNAFLYWVFIPASVILCGKGADFFLDIPRMPGHLILIMLSILFFVTGIVFISKSIRDLSFYGHGTPGSEKPPQRLVTQGSYRLCRHPMFFGYDLAALGVILSFRSFGILSFSFPLFLTLELLFLKKEERILEERFQQQYREYRESVPFLVPGF